MQNASNQVHSSRSLWRHFRTMALGIALAFGLTLGTPRPAQALTIVLDFASAPTTDLFGVGTTADNFAAYGFTELDLAQIRAATLAAVSDDFLGFPAPGGNGQELDIDFEFSTGLSAPSNGDTEYYFVAIGDNTTGNGFLGQACLGCVRDSVGFGPSFGAGTGSIVGSILTDNIFGILGGLASNDAQRINLLAGTIAHEIGHTLSLDHSDGQQMNPGESLWDLMATGVSPSNMPNSERLKDRAFSYAYFDQLATVVGLRQALPAPSVPEPGMLVLFGLGLSLLLWRARPRRIVCRLN